MGEIQMVCRLCRSAAATNHGKVWTRTQEADWDLCDTCLPKLPTLLVESSIGEVLEWTVWADKKEDA